MSAVVVRAFGSSAEANQTVTELSRTYCSSGSLLKPLVLRTSVFVASFIFVSIGLTEEAWPMTLFESKTFLMGRLQGAKSERTTVRRSFASSADVLLQTPVAFKPFVVHGEIWSLTIMDVSPGQLVSGLKFKMPRKRAKVTSKGVFLRTYFFCEIASHLKPCGKPCSEPGWSWRRGFYFRRTPAQACALPVHFWFLE